MHDEANLFALLLLFIIDATGMASVVCQWQCVSVSATVSVTMLQHWRIEGGGQGGLAPPP